jgi:hypothetical protein
MPTSIAVGKGGVFYLADYVNQRVRMRRPDGTIITVAGGGSSPLTDGALATDVGIDFPSGVVVDGQDRLYILSNQNGAVEVWSVGTDSLINRVVSLPASGYSPPGTQRAIISGTAFMKSLAALNTPSSSFSVRSR